MNELALTESPLLRAQYADRVDVLDKVKALVFLPDGLHLSTELVADYYEVDVDAIESVVRRNRSELESNGYRVLRGQELREFETVNLTGSKRRAYALFTRRAILNVGQMLVESPISTAVRKHLLDMEERAREIYLASRAMQQAESQVLQPKTFPFADVVVLMRQEYGVRISVKDLTETLRQGGVLRQDERKPKTKYEAMFWHTGSAYEVHAHHIKGLYHIYESTKLRLQAATQRALPIDPPGWPELPLEGA
ncbi:hypothetical protein ACIBQ1_09535 [Nonomuraea sp. NPDC050153]|uniref:hypothetical protein n=1 Tax=Nonomuraea sp. NPDC050153 TaxID=3364359 RepID=UPI0037A63102